WNGAGSRAAGTRLPARRPNLKEDKHDRATQRQPCEGRRMRNTLFATPAKVPKLRPYQQDVIERVRARIKEGHRRVILQAPTGSGKTICSSEILRLAADKGKNCLFLAHRRRLIAQKSATLGQFGVHHGVLMSGEYGSEYAPVQVASKDTLLARAVRG